LTVPGTASTYEATDLDLIGDKKEEKKTWQYRENCMLQLAKFVPQWKMF
jgi:hypothetical protein